MSKRLVVIEDEVSAAWRKAFAQPIMRHADHDPSLICRPAFGNGLCSPLLLASGGPPLDGDRDEHQGTANQATQHEGTRPGRRQRGQSQLSDACPRCGKVHANPAVCDDGRGWGPYQNPSLSD